MTGQFDPRQPFQFGTVLGPLIGRLSPPEVTVNAVNFDGTNDYLLRDAGLTGAADGKQGAISYWINAGVDDQTMRVLTSATALEGGTMRVQFTRNSDNSVDCIARDASGNIDLRIESSADAATVAAGWVHVLSSWDMTDTTKRHLYITDAEDLATVLAYNDDDLDYTNADWAVGARPSGVEKLDADLSEVWFDLTYIDFSQEFNRRKFISANGKPVDLESDGSGPTGSSPLVYLSGSTADWHTNKGTGGGFTEQGEITTAGSSPSD